MKFTQRYIEMVQHKNTAFAQIGESLYVRRQHWIAPLGPAAQSHQPTQKQCRELLRKLGGLWVMWTGGFQPSAPDPEWYAVICRQHIPVEKVASGNTRSKLRRGLKNCEVRKVDAEEIAAHGYETYCAALQSYRHTSIAIPSKQDFQHGERMDAPFEDIRHQWAVYKDGKMIAFTHNLIYDSIEVDYTMIKLHPAYLKFYPAYALIYKMNEYYLAEKGFQYVNDGFRSISHDTGIQEFLIKKCGFEKAQTGLFVHFRSPFGNVVGLARPFRRLVTTLYPNANALFELDRLRSKSQHTEEE